MEGDVAVLRAEPSGETEDERMSEALDGHLHADLVTGHRYRRFTARGAGHGGLGFRIARDTGRARRAIAELGHALLDVSVQLGFGELCRHARHAVVVCALEAVELAAEGGCV